jgi:hypothetical protein
MSTVSVLMPMQGSLIAPNSDEGIRYVTFAHKIFGSWVRNSPYDGQITCVKLVTTNFWQIDHDAPVWTIMWPLAISCFNENAPRVAKLTRTNTTVHTGGIDILSLFKLNEKVNF